MKGTLFESAPEEVTRLVLVRHGRTQANAESRIGSLLDHPLDEKGWDQARRVAVRLAAYKPDAIYASPILRTLQTAETIAEKSGLKVQINEDLREYYLGKIADMQIQDIEKTYPVIYGDIERWLHVQPNHTMTRPDFPGAESMPSFVERVLRFKDLVLERHPAQCVVAVTHLAIIKAIFTQLTGGDMATQHSIFLADNTSISVIDFQNGSPVIRLFNDIAHLDAPLRYGRLTLI